MENTESTGLQKSQISGANNHFWPNFIYCLYTRTVSYIFKLGRTSGICVFTAYSQQQLIEGEWRHLTNNFKFYLFRLNCSTRYRGYSAARQPLHTLLYKQKQASVYLNCKSRRSKTANIEFYLRIQRTETSDHIYFSQRPFINVKAMFCA